MEILIRSLSKTLNLSHRNDNDFTAMTEASGMILNSTTGYLSSSPDVDILLQTQYRLYDCLLAAGLCLCFLIGLPGNCLALTFFIRSKKRNLPTLLYITACCIDIVSCVIHLPVTVNLLNKRNPGFLGDKILCGIWYFTFLCVQIMSMFVVMMLSVTRAIVIVFPFYKIRKKTVFISILIALLYIMLWETISIISGEYYYSTAFTYCGFDSTNNLKKHLVSLNFSLMSGTPPIMVFTAVFVAFLKIRSQNHLTETQDNRQNASRTIIYFATVFLACNSLTFLNNALLTVSEFSDKSYTYFYNNKFLFFYSWQLSEIFCTVLNAAINPILYMFRFKDMAEWANRVKQSVRPEQ